MNKNQKKKLNELAKMMKSVKAEGRIVELKYKT
jgi:hypothetical protein